MALHSQLFGKYRWLFTIVVYTYGLSLASTYSVDLSIEMPKIQQTTAKPDILGVETFDGLKTGRYEVQEIKFGSSPFKGVYHNLGINARNYYGGAGGKWFYPVANEGTEYRLTITQDGTPGPNYFGLWISSFDADNRLEFYYKGNRIYALNTQDVDKRMGGSLKYRGNPTYKIRLPIEKYVFLNLFFNQIIYDEIRFIAQKHKFESDNHSVGTIKSALPPPPTTTTTPAPPTTTVTLPTTTTISTESVTPVSTTSTRAVPKTAPTLPTTTQVKIFTATRVLLAAAAVGIILVFVGAAILIIYYCSRRQSTNPGFDATAGKGVSPSFDAEGRAAAQRDLTDREAHAEWGE